jgi:hypothetical protein
MLALSTAGVGVVIEEPEEWLAAQRGLCADAAYAKPCGSPDGRGGQEKYIIFGLSVQNRLTRSAQEELPIQRQNARQKVPLATVTSIHCDPEDGASAV